MRTIRAASVLLASPIDRHVDYLQLCHHVDVLKQFPNDEYWPENRSVTRHADGLLTEAIGRRIPLLPIPVKVGESQGSGKPQRWRRPHRSARANPQD